MSSFSKTRQAGALRMLLSGVVLIEFLTVNTKTIYAAPLALATAPVVIEGATTTVQTLDTKVDDIRISTTTRPTALKAYVINVTAYAPNPYKPRSARAITADGTRVHEGVISVNFLPFGTKVRFPTLFGDRVFEVHDRMHARYTHRVDIWLSSHDAARQFGIKHGVKMEVISWGAGKK